MAGKRFIGIFGLFLLALEGIFAISGKVTDQFGRPVENARLEFIDSRDTLLRYVAFTGPNGDYSVDMPVLSYTDGPAFRFYPFYPNPFSDGTLAWLHLDESTELEWQVFNSLGSMVRSESRGNTGPGLHGITWDGRDASGTPLSPGIYFLRLRVGSGFVTRKIVYQPDATVGPPAASFGDLDTGHQTVYYSLRITGDDIESLQLDSLRFDNNQEYNYTVNRIIAIPFATVSEHIGIHNGNGYDPFFIKGVNLGATIPGSFPGELAISREQYRSWLEKMGQAGFNALRIYTLHYPRFYEELLAYNQAHPDHPLYLLQGVWLNEEVPDLDFYQLTDEFDQEIREVVDCIHGRGEIEPRYGKAFGSFTADVSEWVIGFIIGREIHPDEVLTTDALHPAYTAYTGEVFSLPSGTPTEAWITARLDGLVRYEREIHGSERPVSFSSWPTMDPLTHPTESPIETQEDVASFDITRIQAVDAPAGLFVTYHAYPYYPDFISEDPGYQTYSDAFGPNSYIGYLADLRNHYAGLPLILGEYGVPSSWGDAHFSFSGMNHGHHDEHEQGVYFVRQLNNIYDTGCGGAVLFAWADEWFKNTWITEPFDSDPWRRPFWQNITGPEQNFGLIGFDPEPPDFNLWPAVEPGCEITRVQAALSRSFFYVRIRFADPPDPADLIRVAFDTYRADLGESVLPAGDILNNRAEFYLEFDFTGYAQLFVTEAYDLFGIWHGVSGPEQLYHSIATDGQPWMPVRWKNNRYADAIHQVGALQTSVGSTYQTSLDAAYLDGNTVEIRIPWSLLQFTDPLCREVMDDDRSTPEREVSESDGIALTLFYGACRVETPRFTWADIDPIPVVTEREKKSFDVVRQALQTFPDL